MNDLIRYIIRFLLGDHLSEEVASSVGYTADRTLFSNYRLVITPSGFFDPSRYGLQTNMPTLPLQEIEGIPLLYGSPKMEWVDQTLVIEADLVASSFFLLSRYEEWLRPEIRDEHGRFPGRESLPFRAGFLDRPLVDEYGQLLRRGLSMTGVTVPEPPQQLRAVYLTHDVDVPFSRRSWRNVARRVKEGTSPFRAIADRRGALEEDPFYTFPWLMEKNRAVVEQVGTDRTQTVLFFRAGGDHRHDRPFYDLFGGDLQSLLLLCRHCQAHIGLHSSYRSGISPAGIAKEKATLEKAIGEEVRWNRHHFLASREPEDMTALTASGITDDFTMGYADVAGYRLGTARAVHFLRPDTVELTSLLLHPLTMMDCTLSEEKYMGLSEEEALGYALRLIANSRRVNGEVTLLWHNTTLVKGDGYHRSLYSRVLDEVMANRE